MRRVMVTGIGVISALGINGLAFWRGLMDGTTGMRAGGGADASGRAYITARAPIFDIHDYVDDERITRVCHRSFELLLVAADEAVEDAGLNRDLPDTQRLGIAIGLGSIDQHTDDFAAFSQAVAQQQAEAWRRLHPLRRLRHLPNIPAAALSMRYGAAGPSLTIVSGVIAGLQAILEGFHMIACGRADAVVCGGTDSQFSAGLWPKLQIQHSFSPSGDAETACRPFDRRHNGIVPGEAAAVLVLEAAERCQRRGKTAYAEILGGGSESSPSRGVSTALAHLVGQMASRYPQPDTVIAHGDGGVCTDLAEAAAYVDAPYFSRVNAITSIQPAVGHTFAAAGAIGTAAACASLRIGEVPAIRNLCDPIVSAPFVSRRSQPDAPTSVVANVLDRRGLAAAVVLASAAC